MDTKQALAELGARDELITGEQREFLDTFGYLELPGILSSEHVEDIGNRLMALSADPTEEKHIVPGTDFHIDLANKGPQFDVLYTHPQVLTVMAHVLGNDLKVSSLNARDTLPGEGQQGWHTDWVGPPIDPGDFQVCNAVWMIDDFTPENGATRLKPGSHIGKPMAEIFAVGPAGTVVVFNSHTHHAGSLNSSSGLRRAILSFFTRRCHPQQCDQKEHIRPETYARLSEAARYILDV